jgi:hypothetical protein
MMFRNKLLSDKTSQSQTSGIQKMFIAIPLLEISDRIRGRADVPVDAIGWVVARALRDHNPDRVGADLRADLTVRLDVLFRLAVEEDD